MKPILHLTSGDGCGGSLAKSGVPGEVFVWHDVLYEGPRSAPGWPDAGTIAARALFLTETMGGGLSRELVLDTLTAQYQRLEAAAKSARLVLWFDACLFDQAMLAHVLTCLQLKGARDCELLCVEAFPGIEPYDGLGQLTPQQMAPLYDRRRPVTAAQFAYAEQVDRAFATQDPALLAQLASGAKAPLPWVPAAVARWLQERPDPKTGLGRLEQLALDAIRSGCQTPAQVFTHAAAHDIHPQYWGDTTLWAKVNALADRQPPLVHIAGPLPRLPQWHGIADLREFRVTATP